MSESLRPRGTVEVACFECAQGQNLCQQCTWEPGEPPSGPSYFWVDALDSRLPDGPFVCDACAHKRKLHRACGLTLKHRCQCPPNCSHSHESRGAS